MSGNHPTDKARKVQIIFMSVAAAAVLGIVGAIVVKVKNDVADPEASQHGWGFKADEEHIAQSKYINQVGDDVKGIESENKTTQEEVKAMRAELKALKEGGGTAGKLQPPPPTMTAQSGGIKGGFLNNLYDKYPVAPTAQAAQPTPSYQSQPQVLPVLPPPPAPVVEKPIFVYEYENNIVSGNKGEAVEVNATGKSGATVKEKKRIFVPSTTQVRVVLVNGFNAPTLRNGQNVKAPVMVKAVDNFMLPNGRRLDFKSCNFQGEAFGKLSDQRAYPRMTTMACIDKNNNPIELPITGYITDEHGSDGIAGTPVTLQNELINNALWASAISGFSNIAAQRNTITSTSAIGMTQTNGANMSDQFQSGVFGGVARTGGKLEDFLFDNIKAIETVIEVKGRRDLVLHFTTGFYVYEDGSKGENVQIQKVVQPQEAQNLGGLTK